MPARHWLIIAAVVGIAAIAPIVTLRAAGRQVDKTNDLNKTTKQLALIVARIDDNTRDIKGLTLQNRRIARRNCLGLEELKATQRESAAATIAGDKAFLEKNKGGTKDFPEAVVRADIAAKQRVLDKFAAKPCPA